MARDTPLALLALGPTKLANEAGSAIDRIVGDFFGPKQDEAGQIAQPIVARQG